MPMWMTNLPLLWRSALFFFTVGRLCSPPPLIRLAVGSHSRGREMQPRLLWPPVVIGPYLSRMVPSYHLTFTSQKGTLLLVHPMLATLCHRSGYLQDGAIVPSDLLTSQKGTPLLDLPMLHPNMGCNIGRNLRSAFPAIHVSPQ